MVVVVRVGVFVVVMLVVVMGLCVTQFLAIGLCAL